MMPFTCDEGHSLLTQLSFLAAFRNFYFQFWSLLYVHLMSSAVSFSSESSSLCPLTGSFFLSCVAIALKKNAAFGMPEKQGNFLS